MTKSHILLYVLAVVGITISAYLYTSTAEAPHSLTLEESTEIINEVSVEETNPSEPIPLKVETEENVMPVSTMNVTELTGSTWQWLRNEDSTGTKIFSPKNSQAFKMQFTGTRMSSATDCNTIGGSYDLVGTKLSFGPLMSTLMYCEGSEDAIYSTSLSTVAEFKIDAAELRLISSDGSAMVFASLEL